MFLKEKQSYQLPVKRKVSEGKNEFYVVENNGVEYKIKLYDFQKTRPVPSTLLVHTVALQSDGIILTQDYSLFLSEFYKVGESYPFKVVSVHTANKPPYYKVRDKNGFNFRLIDYGGIRLSEHDDIICKVTNLEGYKLRLKLVSKEGESLLPFFTTAQLGDAIGQPALGKYVEYILKNDPAWEFIAAPYREKRGEWILRLLSAVNNNYDISAGTTTLRRSILKGMMDISLFLLEGSAFLKNLDDNKRRRTRNKLENNVRRYDTLLKAVDIVESGREKEVIDDILSKMKNSGYLYNPGEKLDLMVSIFTLRPEIVEENMSLILEIITGGNHTNWMQEPFRSAFLKQLDFYIIGVKDKADRASYDDQQGRELLTKMMQALAIHALMVGKSNDSYLQLNRAALFRYLTYENPSLGKKLLDKAFLSITDSIESVQEYEWDDVTDLKRLSVLMSKGLDNGSKAITTQMYEGATASLQIAGDHIHLTPLTHGSNLKPVLPEDMIPWHSIQIYASGKVPAVSPGETKLNSLRNFWHDVETLLFRPEVTADSHKDGAQYAPEIGDVVDIIILEAIDEGYNFSARIVDDKITGDGTISIQEMSKFINTPQNADMFRNADGNPYLLRAEVVGLNKKDGTAQFSLLPQIKEYMEYSLEFHHEMPCMILGYLPKYWDRDGHYSKGYFGFSLDGDSIMCLFDGQDPHINIGEVVNVAVEYINGEKCQAICRFRGRVQDHKFDRQKAFENFILRYSEGAVFETPQEEEEEEIQLVPMDVENLRELILIIDRAASLEEDHVRMYNYLSFCHILAMLIDNRNMAAYYNHRTTLLRTLEDYVKSGYINLDEIKFDDDDILDYPSLRMYAQQIRILSYFDKPEKNDLLWDIIRNDNTKATVAMAKLALLSNMSMEFRLSQEVRKKANEEISRLFNIKVKLPELISFGSEEGQELEFKSSYLYDQEFHYNPDRQRDHIMERICGFLNSATGGRLYIGVNDYGFASGLEEDMKSYYFQGHGTRDKFDLKVRNDIRSQLGYVANDCISTEWIDAKGKDVYCINIKACSYPVKFNRYFWIRQGTSTYPHDYEAYSRIVAARNSGKSEKSALPQDNKSKYEETSPAAEEYISSDAPSAAQVETPPQSSSPADAYQLSGYAFSTGSIRPNSRNEWEDNFIPPLFYINFLDGGLYDITEEINWQTENFLAVRGEEQDMQIVLVYADGKTLRVAVSDFANKAKNKSYARYKDEPLVFASVADAGDSILMVYEAGGKTVARVDSVADIRSGSMTDTPSEQTTGDFDKVKYCDIVPAEYTPKLKPLLNISRSKAGNGINAILRRQLIAIGITESAFA